MTVKEVDINSKALYINIIIIIIVKVGSTLALIITPYYTRFRTTKFRITRFCITSKAIDKGIIIYKYNYILSSFN
jgi:hypothetical protein